MAEAVQEKSLDKISKRIPINLLTTFETEQANKLYASILDQLMRESLPEGSTILQILVVERVAFYFTKFRQEELKGKDFNVTQDYKFYVWEYNRNLEVLRALSIRNLPAQQAAVLARRTISVIERIIKDPTQKDKVIKELVKEYTIEVPLAGFANMKIELDPSKISM
jgi:hypothetical protein